jgi:hypothetical protein
MPIDWTSLQGQTTQYTSLTTTTDPVSQLTDVIYCGLETSLSAVLAGLSADTLNSVSIFVDTLQLDVPEVKATGLILMARQVDVSGLDGQPLVLDTGGQEGLAEVLIGGALNGTFSLATPGGGSAAVQPPAGVDSPVAATYMVPGAGGPPAPAQSGGVADLARVTWAQNSLQASFTAAASLLSDGSPDALSAARSMLTWVVACTASLSTAGAQLPSDYAALYNQAAALLLTMNVPAGTVFVPVLSGTYYSQQITPLLTVVRDYESNMATLDTASDIASAVAAVSAALQGVAGDEAAPIQVQLDNVKQNVQSLYAGIQSLRGEFLLQSQAASTAFALLKDAIALQHIRDQLSADLDLALSVISVGFDAFKITEGDAGAFKDAITDGVAAIKNGIAVIQKAQAGGPGDDLSTSATDLLDSQQALLQTVLNGNQLWNQAMASASGGVLPSDLASITLDPTTVWDNYMAAAGAKLSTLKREIGDSSPQEELDNYAASLQILANYGKAISAKCVAYVAQLVQATVLIAQIHAASNVMARWAQVDADAKSDAERLAALKGVIQARSDAIKRAIYAAWTYYAASYFYLTFQKPPSALNVDMTAAQMEDALAGVAAWVAGALGSTADGQHVQLPSQNAQIDLAFSILQPGASVDGNDAAVLQQTADGGWMLNWSVPIGTSQLEGVLPNGGDCAIWISEASFFLDGVTPNSKDNVISVVSTSGTYENGFGPQADHTFVTRGLSGNYLYHANNDTVFGPWQIDTAVYMTPTPYTQWTMTLPSDGGDPSTATQLRMSLTVAFLTPS